MPIRDLFMAPGDIEESALFQWRWGSLISPSLGVPVTSIISRPCTEERRDRTSDRDGMLEVLRRVYRLQSGTSRRLLVRQRMLGASRSILAARAHDDDNGPIVSSLTIGYPVVWSARHAAIQRSNAARAFGPDGLRGVCSRRNEFARRWMRLVVKRLPPEGGRGTAAVPLRRLETALTIVDLPGEEGRTMAEHGSCPVDSNAGDEREG